MINRDEIEAGDKCFTRDGEVLVMAREALAYYAGIKGTIHHVQATSVDAASMHDVSVLGTNHVAMKALTAIDNVMKVGG